VEVDEQRLQAREPRVAFVEVAPPGLHERDARVLESRERATQEVARRDEIGVEDGDQLGSSPLQSMGQRAGLETCSRAAPDVRDQDALAAPVGQPPGDDLDRLVVRVVEGLDLESAFRPVERAGRVKDSLGDIALVVDGDLHAHERKISSPFMGRWPAGPEGQAERADREEENVQPESEQQRARQDQDRDGDDADQASSKKV